VCSSDLVEIAKECDLVFNTMPNHPLQHDWPNHRNIYEETWVMAGLPLEAYHSLSKEQQRPKLYKWFDVEKQPQRTIAIWPCAGYGKEMTRNPSKHWYFPLIGMLTLLGYKVIQFGHPKDYNFNDLVERADVKVKQNFSCQNHLSFFEQIKMSLGCDLAIATDSGSSLVLGAYEMPQITLLTNHFPNHIQNLSAFAPNNPNNINFISINGPDNTNLFEVCDKIKEIVKI
jgi:ADP-heptose:LPS heptosyltransferase